tara:strand:+ start:2874 stop:3140 length:267 start_codon:yes stop_codon:yes gene_type:complete
MTIKELMKEFKNYPSDTRLDFIMVDRNWEDVPYDPEINYFGIVGSGEQTDDCEKGYIEVAFKVLPESRETLKELLITNDEYFEGESDD